MPFVSAALSPRERRMVEKLVQACRLLDTVYWRQSDFGGFTVYNVTHDQTLKSLLSVMGGRWDVLDRNQFFLGEVPMPLGREWYPHDLTRPQVEEYVRQHPEDRAAIYDPHTVVRWQGARLVGTQYHEAYKQFLNPASKLLDEAAGLSDDKAFANFLRLRARSLLTDDYRQSDAAWLDLKSPKFDLIFGPYDLKMDRLLGVKAAYGAAILIRNDDDTMNVLYSAGSLVHGYQSLMFAMPKKILFRNLAESRLANVILPLAQRLLDPAQAAKLSSEGYLAVLAKADPNAIPRDRLEAYYASYVAELLSTIRESRGAAETMEFNYLFENHALTYAGGRYIVDYAQMPGTIAAFAKERREIEATGDRARAEAWSGKYGSVPPELKTALAGVADIPMEIRPIFSFAENVQ